MDKIRVKVTLVSISCTLLEEYQAARELTLDSTIGGPLVVKGRDSNGADDVQVSKDLQIQCLICACYDVCSLY
jgi:hypothetical protein